MRRHRTWRTAPLLLATVLITSGCLPNSLRSHLPQRSQLSAILHNENTGPVQTAPQQLLLEPYEMPTSFTGIPQMPAPGVAFVNPFLTAYFTATVEPGLAQWHFRDGSSMTYFLPRDRSTIPDVDAPRVQIGIGRYASLTDARNAFSGMTGPAVPPFSGAHWSPSPAGLGALSAEADADHPLDDVRLITFQERNLVVQLAIMAPPSSPALAWAPAIAKTQHDKVVQAK